MDSVGTTILISSLGIVSGIISSFLTTYFTTKSQYKAMAEEIGNITTIVKGVEKAFQDDTEKFKQELSVLTNKHTVLFNEEKEALYDYLSAWLLWIDNIDTKSSTFSKRQYKDLTDVVDGLNEMHSVNRNGYSKVLISISKIELFVNNIVLNQTIYDLNKITASYESINDKYIEAYMWNNYNWTRLENKLKVALPEDEIRITKEMQANRKEIRALKVEYDKERQASFNQVLLVKANFISLSKTHIRKDL